MTEQEWMECDDPEPMLRLLREDGSDRKFRLFAAACCRRIEHLLTDERSQKAVDAIEQYADGLGSKRLLRWAGENAFSAFCALPTIPEIADRQQATHSVSYAADRNSYFAAYQAVMHAGDAARGGLNWGRGHNDQCPINGNQGSVFSALLRDIFGSLPFRTVAVSPFWQTSNVIAIAQGIYDNRAFDRLPILADALEDAGCTNQEILAHCRGPSPHARGCWAVDLLLGKE